MCGIFGFVSSPPAGRGVAAESFFETIDSLLALGVDPSGLEGVTETEEEAILETLRAAVAMTYRWVGREGFLAVLRSEDLQRRLEETASRVRSWTTELSDLSQSAGLERQRDRELINQMIVGAKDIAWQLQRDCLENLDPVRRVVRMEDDASPPERLLGHAWQLGLVLSGVNRLEVRGRDSAGIAVYARFPGVGSLESFLDGPAGGVGWRQEFESRASGGALKHFSVLRPTGRDDTLLFVFKVANEIGKMGDNVAFLRAAIIDDRLFQAVLREADVDIQCLAHTRWASNGIISESNCHPVDSACYAGAPGSDVQPGTPRTLEESGQILAVLNGDIDNYQELLGVYLDRLGGAIDPTITTDAKIIPLAVNYHFRQSGDLLEAFHRAFAEFEGSMAIGVMAADRPGEFVFGQKGSGQGLYLGVSDDTISVASEMYGVVEFSQRYIKAEGESVQGGEVFHLDAREPGHVKVSRSTFDPQTGKVECGEIDSSRHKTAEITTRDINRGDFRHFLAKEITESVDSVRKTIRGKFEVAGGSVRSLLGDDVLPPDLLEALRSGRVRRILVIGQGTAAVAGQGVAHLLREALAVGDSSWQIGAMKATELSGHHMSPDMSDALIIAISQSGTTTDTNRTVDMARERGAWVTAIVNRRNSDLVYKSHGVLYTSDGRDIEMSVASTKAFYAQNVAGQVLALTLALEMGTLAPEAIVEELRSLERLPDLMRETLALAPQVKEMAETHAVKRRYWALVGSGASKIAADEIRIKLSELCYKSIASDFLEDKKHIDLSSEPLVLVCANGAPPRTISDIVKEVAIFKAHSAIPLVITDEGENRFDAYAAETIKLPRCEGRLSYLLTTMVGHLFGYHAAATFDRIADSLRRVRTEVIDLAGIDHVGEDTGAGSANDQIPPTRVVDGLSKEVTRELAELNEALRNGGLDSGLDAGVATRLGEAIGFLLGRYPVDTLSYKQPSFIVALLSHLSGAINQLARPIDAIKHQAKTVTVGVSRTEETVYRGGLWEAYRGLGLEPEAVAESHRRVLSALEPLVSSVDGVTLYRVTGLDPMGRPTDESRVGVLAKEGCAAKILSRCEESQPLSGTKWGVVKRREIYLGYGQNDSRKIFVLPVVDAEGGHVVLFHLDLVPFGKLEDRMRALQTYERHHERLRIAVTEGSDLPWEAERLEGIDNDTLFFASAEKAAAAILEGAASASPQGVA